jgi:uncharacterized protein (TIGR03083 family)
MSPPSLTDYRSHLDRELTAYAAALDAAVASPGLLDRRIPACPAWDVRGLTHHLISVHAWVAHAIVRSGDDERAMPADAALPAEFSASAAVLREVLDRPPDTACWTFTEDRTVAFWQRRQAHENAIHRWDLESALGRDGRLDADLATDGIDEVVTMFWPRQVRLGRAQEPGDQVLLHTPDGRAWPIGRLQPNTGPCAQVSGSPEDLCLALWGRIGWDDRSLKWAGDRAAADVVLTRKLVP